MVAVAGSTVNVQFNPLGQPNSLVLSTLYQSGGTPQQIATTGGMISDINNIFGVFMFNQSVNITNNNAGTIQYSIQNTLPSQQQDTWQLQIQVVGPLMFNPVPIIRSNLPSP